MVNDKRRETYEEICARHKAEWKSRPLRSRIKSHVMMWTVIVPLGILEDAGVTRTGLVVTGLVSCAFAAGIVIGKLI